MQRPDINEIVQQLEETYPDEEIPEENLPYLREMVISLNGFEDLDTEINLDDLKDILEKWLDLRNEL